MSIHLTGYVLRGSRSAPSNAQSTADADTGVLRDIRDLPDSYDLPGKLVEPYADMYRAAVLDHPVPGTQEYLIWAANSSSLAVVEDPDWAVTDGRVSIPVGTLEVMDGSTSEPRVDGTSRLIVLDNAGRSIAEVRKIVVVRGDTGDRVEAGPQAVEDGTGLDFERQDADAGVVVLHPDSLDILGGGVSVARGDTIESVSYVLAAQKFWWTRNDQYTVRFGWRGATQRWEPFKGSAPVKLGTLLSGKTYTMTPRPSRFGVGDKLPGDASRADAYAMIRVGSVPGSVSLPVDVLVVPDEDAENDDYVFPINDPPDAVVGVSNGVLRFHPDYVEAHAGKTIWYVYESFQEEATGDLGALADAVDGLYLCPVPGPTDRPFVSLGSRRYLVPHAVDTEADLPASVPEGEFFWARSTGRIKLSQVDIDKANPDSGGFDPLYLGCRVVYDGVALSEQPIPLPEPCQLVESDGTTPAVVTASNRLYLPEAVPMPYPGVSGALRVYDRSGVEPSATSSWTARPSGTGLVRSLDAVGDKVFFSKSGSFPVVRVVDLESGPEDNSLPKFSFRIRQGDVWVALQANDTGASIPRVELGSVDRTKLSGEAVYFRQAMVVPAVYMSEARIYSRVVEPFVLDGTEKLAFAVDGVAVDWSASSLVSTVGAAEEFSAEEIASSLQSAVSSAGGHSAAVYAFQGRIVIEAAVPSVGTVEIGFGSTTDGSVRDLSGCAALGFLPGWRVDPQAGLGWLPDSGVGFGVYRSPENLEGGGVDFKNRSRVEDLVISGSVQPSPYVFPDFPPLLDVAGLDEGVFFSLHDGMYVKWLRHMEQVFYDFANGRFGWLGVESVDARAEYPTRHLELGRQFVIPDSLHPVVLSGGGLYGSEDGGPVVPLVYGTDYLLADNGETGVAHLVEVVGGKVASGSSGAVTLPSTFSDASIEDWTALGVQPGYWLKIEGGDNAGVYVISSVDQASLIVDGSFRAQVTEVPWSIYEAYPLDVYDPGVVADCVWVPFKPVKEDPVKLRVLSALGTLPGDQGTSRHVASMADAVRLGRPVAIRFGLDFGEPEASLSPIQSVVLGQLANGTLKVPDVSDPHFTEGSFEIQVGSVRYRVGDAEHPLVGVASLTPDLSGDVVEYDLVTGDLNFGSTVLESLAGSNVLYVETFSDPDNLPAGSAEYNPSTGEINYSNADLVAHVGKVAYLVETLIPGVDVQVNPLAGAFHLASPVRAGQVVEVGYDLADSTGGKLFDSDGNPVHVVEKLPIYIRQEAATRVSETVYRFNQDGKTLADAPVRCWVGVQLQNYGQKTVDVDTSTGELHFLSPVDASATVLVDYAVYEAVGGEQTYTTSQRPLYWPTLLIEAGQDTFVLDGDWTPDLEPGMVLLVGAFSTYIQDVVYDASSSATSVTIYPAPIWDVGSRSPGHDVDLLLSSIPVAPQVGGVSTSANGGFLLDVDVGYEPVDQGSLQVVFHGDVRRYARPNHLLDLDGVPHVVVGHDLSDDGRFTVVHLRSPVLQATSSGQVKLSARPIYPHGAIHLEGVAPILDSEEYEVVLFDEGSVGRVLVETADYSLDPSTGSLTLLSPRQGPLQPGQRIAMRFTKLREVSPFLQDDAIIFPVFKATYAFITTPDESNGYLGATLKATYTFRNPDTFYCRTVPLASYMGEVAEEAVQAVTGMGPHAGPVVVDGGSPANWTQGTVGATFQLRDLLDRDRAARSFIGLYNAIIVAFEQVKETINGEIVGDRDGKFRFEVGRGVRYPPPGYEDEVTGYMVPRLVWSDVFESISGFAVTVSDPLVDPETATQDPVTMEVSGSPMDGFLLKTYMDAQRSLIRNDIDDLVLVRPKAPKMSLGIPLPSFWVPGDFRRMGDPHGFSRLFPERATVLATLFPGLQADLANGDPGVYSFAKMLEPPSLLQGAPAVIGSTFRTPIGVMANPAWGTFERVADCDARNRYPRARIWRYSPTGFPELDPHLPAGSTFSNNPRPAVLVSLVPLKDLSLDPATGLPDVTQFAANGGGLPDATTGDPALHIPPFKPADLDSRVLHQVAFGRPDGATFEVGTGKVISSLLPDFGDFEVIPRYRGVFVGEVLLGCVLTFSDGKDIITDAADIFQVGAGELEAIDLVLDQGDTIFVVPPGGMDPSEMGLSSPPTTKDLGDLTGQVNTYSRFQLGQKTKQGLFVDNSLPSIRDPNPLMLKELLSQKTPDPLTTIEADIEFINGEKKHFVFPALKGEPTNDSGDYSIPYLRTTNTELDRLGEAARTFRAILGPDAISTNRAVYPDEIAGSDGVLLSAAQGNDPPATLLTSVDLTPPYVPHSGTGPVEPWDLLLVQAGQPGVDAGMTGILQVGSVGLGSLEPARFVTPTKPGTDIFYVLDNAMAFITGGGSAGIEIVDDGTDIILSIQSVSDVVLNDGSGSTPTGGWNNFVTYPAYPNNNVIKIRVFDPASGALLESIAITGSTVIGGGPGSPGTVVSAPEFTDKTIILRGVGGSSVLANAAGSGVFFDFTLSVDTSAGGSQTAYIQPDRLTFFERIDLRRALPRGSQTADGVYVDCRLNVTGVTGSGGSVLTVNDGAEVNGGWPFTFLPRVEGGRVSDDWTPAATPGDGNEGSTLKVMGFEKFSPTISGDSSLTPASGIVFSAIPSSAEDENGIICRGVGVVGNPLNAITGLTSAEAVQLPNVQRGDLCRITGGSAGEAAVTAGTYVVLGVVEETDPSAPTGYAEVSLAASAPNTGSWLLVEFPRIVGWDQATKTITVDTIQQVPDSPTGEAWETSGTLYILVDTGDMTRTIRVPFTRSGTTFTVDDLSASLVDASATPVSDFWGSLKVGQRVSGMVYLPVNNRIGNLPEANAVGFDSGNTTAAGILHLTVYDPSSGGYATYTKPVGPGMALDGPMGGSVVVSAKVPASPSTYNPEPTTYFEGVPSYVDFSGMDPSEWESIRGSGSGKDLLACPVLGDRFVLNDAPDLSGSAGFLAASGIYLEPSFPTPVQDLGDGLVKVVDVNHTGARAGMRDPSAYGGGSTESVSFEVRRIRRWHDLTLDVEANLAPLRYAYETRVGTGWTYTAADRVFSAPGATQLGAFDDPNVGIHAGDVVRILDGDGNLVGQAEISAVLSGTTLRLKPGLGSVDQSGSNFEIYLRTAPVPHQQSNEQLLDLVTEAVILERKGDPVAGVGGRVVVPNELRDGDPTVDFLAAGVQVGDILVVDPAGDLVGASGNPADPPERGSRPMGDTACPARDGAFVPGAASNLDDNRGHYWIVDVASDAITVSPAHAFAGDGVDVIFGDAGSEYVVLPTVYGSQASWADNAATLPDGSPAARENQNDLRPTSPPDANDSYAGDNNSIEFFSYKVIRPSTVFSQETVDLILFMRERMLSWMEELEVAVQGSVGGTYRDFQEQGHVEGVGPYPNGVGVPFNDMILSLEGLVLESPFANADDCLSILDRRFWCLDLRLDLETPPSYSALSLYPYAKFSSDGTGRPVLPDLIDDVLDNRDRFRSLRDTWIGYRVDRVDGTLPSIDRFDEALRDKQAKMDNLRRIKESTK